MNLKITKVNDEVYDIKLTDPSSGWESPAGGPYFYDSQTKSIYKDDKLKRAYEIRWSDSKLYFASASSGSFYTKH